MTAELRHLVCRLLWSVGLGYPVQERSGWPELWVLNADKYAQCVRCGFVDKSVRFSLPEDE